jgi:gliding motility-associated-like protein
MGKKKQIFRWVVFLFLNQSVNLAFAQQSIVKSFVDSNNAFQHICSNDVLLQELRKDKSFRAREEKMNQQILHFARPAGNDTLTLPVVIHIINQNPYAVSDAAVLGGIGDLNDAFGKSGAYALSPGADTKIKFCIAKKDPDGGITTGITRTTAYFGNDLNLDNEDAKLKNLIQWDPKRYINIWLITNIYAESYANYSCGIWTRLGVGGYATMPPGGDSLDGIVVTSFGVLLAHEMGHYLGLYHTFQGGCYNFNCATDGDMVCDTPPDGSVYPSFTCNNPSNSCNSDTLSAYSNGFFHTDVPDQIDNFMDYGNSACSKQFTQGQADRMRAAILTQRPGLLQEECSAPCTENMIAGFTRDTAYTALGDAVSFTNTSLGATNYTWLVNDVVTAADVNFKYTFNAIGKYKITLKAFNANASCFAASTCYVIVNCGVSARFFTNKKAIASTLPLFPDSILFTNTSFRAQSYQWLIGNDKGMSEQVVSTDVNLIYTFPGPANYTIRLVATNGSCSDTTSFYYVYVQDASPDGVVYLSSAVCYQQTKVRLNFCIDNYGFAPLPKGTPVTFYDADPWLPGAKKLSPTFYLPYQTAGGNCRYCFNNHIIDVGYAHLNQVYAVFNDSGNTAPLVLPNTLLPEKNYVNNVSVFSNIRFGVNTFPATATLLPGDTLQLLAQSYPTPATYLWSAPQNLTCTVCSNPQLYADSDRVKRVIATSAYGCIDTSYVTIKVPPANDYTIKINSLCVAKDSMTVNFTLFNQFFRGVIPKNLTVSFYKGDPTTNTAVLLQPVFNMPDTVFALQQNFNTKINAIPPGNLYAVVNDSSMTVPISLPNTPKLEKVYTNNMHSIAYIANKTSFDIAICQGSNYFGYNKAGTYTDTISGYNGCDSIRTVNLIVKPVFATTISTAICQGENYAGHTATGTYIDVYPAINGCDSTRTLHLIVKPLAFSNIKAVICQGENYAGHTATGTYIDIYQAANGCDSTRTLTLTVNPTKAFTINPEICEGESYFAGGRLRTLSGTYYDTAKTYLGCDSIKTTHLTVHPNPVPDLGADRGICLDDTYTLNPGTFTSYLWQNGSTGPTFTTAVLGRYYVNVKNVFGCKAADTIVLDRILPLPKNYLPTDSNLCKGNILPINVPGYKTYLWSTNSAASFIDITSTGTYKLQVTDGYDCKGTDSMKVFFYTDCIIIAIPSAFSPNGDGLNETFKPLIPAPVTNYSMQIFNRAGVKIFETSKSAIGWDGTYKGSPQDPAAYVYYITLVDYTGRQETRKGTMVLVR